MKKTLQQIYKQNGSLVIYDYELLDYVKDNIISHKEMIPCLFRYSKADYYNIRGIEKQTLFLSPVGAMNDVFEGLSGKVDDDVLSKLDNLNDIVFMKSFSEECMNLLLWAHYADNYAGMCVQYDFSKLPEEILFHLFPVVYSEKRFTNKNLTKYTAEELLDLKRMNSENNYPNETDYIRDIMSLFLVKPDCWSYENEWRLIATYPQIFNKAEEIGDEEVAELYNINYQTISVSDCIKAVYLGPKMKKEIKDHIYEICKDKLYNVSVYEMSLSPEKYTLVDTLYMPNAGD